MTSTVLASSWHKFHWAQIHMRALDAALGRIFELGEDTIAIDTEVKIQGDDATALVRIATLPLISSDCALILGDTLQNFRAALDHLAWDLVKIGTQPNPFNPQQIYFPMTKSGKSFGRLINQRLPGVNREYRAIVRRYQPYGRGKAAKAIRWLRNLSDADKHRVMTPMVVNASHINLTVSSNWTLAGFEYIVTRPRALDVGTEVARAKFIRSGAEGCAVKMYGHLPIYPALTYGRSLDTVLVSISETVREILVVFDEVL